MSKSSERIKCTVRGQLYGGRAMCGEVTVGCEYCGLKRGECNLQEGAEPGAADGQNHLLPPLSERAIPSRTPDSVAKVHLLWAFETASAKTAA